MNYREPGFLGVVRCVPSPPQLSVSSTGDTEEVLERETHHALGRREGGMEGSGSGRSQIISEGVVDGYL
jgi:hypothetical protein